MGVVDLVLSRYPVHPLRALPSAVVGAGTSAVVQRKNRTNIEVKIRIRRGYFLKFTGAPIREQIGNWEWETWKGLHNIVSDGTPNRRSSVRISTFVRCVQRLGNAHPFRGVEG